MPTRFGWNPPNWNWFPCFHASMWDFFIHMRMWSKSWKDETCWNQQVYQCISDTKKHHQQKDQDFDLHFESSFVGYTQIRVVGKVLKKVFGLIFLLISSIAQIRRSFIVSFALKKDKLKTKKPCEWHLKSFILRSFKLNIYVIYPCVEFGRLGCTSFIFIKEVPFVTMTFWLKCHLTQKWHLFLVLTPMSVSRAARRGVTTAVHTDAQVLHPAVLQDFLQHVRALLEAGRQRDAETLWDSVYEIVHIPIPHSPVREFPTLPAMRRVACSAEGCRRCNAHLGGYQFPWIGTWTRSSVVVRPGDDPAQAWFQYHENDRTMELLALERLASGFGLEDLLPPSWDQLVEYSSDAPGCATVDNLCWAFRGWQQGHDLWRDPLIAIPGRQEAWGSARGRAQRSLAAWLLHLQDNPEIYLAAPCFTCGHPTRRICADCRLAFCQGCARAGRENFCCEESRAQGLDGRYELPAVRFGETTAQFFRRFIRQFAPRATPDPWATRWRAPQAAASVAMWSSWTMVWQRQEVHTGPLCRSQPWRRTRFFGHKCV